VFDWNRLQGHQQITDVYLLALEVAHGGRLVTFDQRIQRQAVWRCGEDHLVTL
jgi:predicted nucleic acid-binding protein